MFGDTFGIPQNLRWETGADVGNYKVIITRRGKNDNYVMNKAWSSRIDVVNYWMKLL